MLRMCSQHPTVRAHVVYVPVHVHTYSSLLMSCNAMTNCLADESSIMVVWPKKR